MSIPVLPDFPYWAVINHRRKLIDRPDWKKWYLPDLIHYCELKVITDHVHVTVMSEGYEDVVIDVRFSLLTRGVHDAVNMACVLAEQKFCKEDAATIINRYRSGN